MSSILGSKNESINENLSPEEIISSAVISSEAQLLSEELGVLIYLEGEDDYLALSDHLNKDSIDIRFLTGKPKILQAAIDSEHISNTFFVVDRDFDLLLRYDRYPTNVIATVYHDLFTEIVLKNQWIINTAIILASKQKLVAGNPLDIDKQEIIIKAFAFSTALAKCRYFILKNRIEISTIRNIPLDKYKLGNQTSKVTEVSHIYQLISNRIKDSEYRNNGEKLQSEVESIFASISDDKIMPLVGDHDFVNALYQSTQLAGFNKYKKDIIENVIMSKIDCRVLAENATFQKIVKRCESVVNQKITNCSI